MKKETKAEAKEVIDLQYVLQNLVRCDRTTEFSVSLQFTSARMASEFIKKVEEANK